MIGELLNGDMFTKYDTNRKYRLSFINWSWIWDSAQLCNSLFYV